MSRNVVAVVFVVVLDIFALAKYGGGTGKPAEPYLIYTAGQLNTIGLQPNDWSSHFRLMKDIDLSPYIGSEFNIISPYPDKFTGTFDGNGHSIANFTYTDPDTDEMGLFARVGNGGEIRNLALVDVNITTSTWWAVGALVGWNDGTISNCSATGRIHGSADTGGLVGFNRSGLIIDSAANVTISHGEFVGGLVGDNFEGTISRCYAATDVCGYTFAGGLVGGNADNGLISNCYAAGTVSGCPGAHSVGGLIGWNAGQVTNSFAVAGVRNGDFVGALVGEDYDGAGRYAACFWNVELNGSVSGIGNIEDPNTVIGETTADMQTAGTFTTAGWDFVGETQNGTEDIWRICNGTNYPRFPWQILPADFACPDGVNFIDYSFFAHHWLENCPDPADCCGTDLDSLGSVDANDLSIFASHWLQDI